MATSTYTQYRFIGDGVGASVDLRQRPCSKWSLQVRGSGMSATAWTVVLESSLDGGLWTTILTHNTATLDGVTVSVVDKPALFYRVSLSGLTLAPAGALYAHVLGME